MKKHLFILCISLLCINLSFAQEAGKLRGGLEGGFVIPHENNTGFLGAAEVKYNMQDNMNIGFKTEFTRHWKYNVYIKLLSFSITYDYYFHYTNRQFSPFIGAGLGYYFYKAESTINNHYVITWYDEGESPTFFIRTGFEAGKFRTTVTYNVIRNPSERIEVKRGEYLSLSVGFYFGGGKWKKDE